MDNRVFDVNGDCKERFTLALRLLLHKYGKDSTVKAWSVNKKNGFILYWYYDENDKNVYKFPTELTYDTLVEIIWAWLKSDEAKTIELGAWENDLDHDGHNNLGWRVYTENWGRINEINSSYTLGAIKPIYCWYGK